MTKTCCKIQVLELAKIFHSFWSVSSPVPPAMMAASKILQKAEETFCGSGDLEANDAINFHDYFMSQYPPGSANRDGLEAEFKHLETRLTNLVGWVPATHVTHVLNFPMGNEVQRFVVAPWQLGLSSDDSIKGPSKMVYILDTVSSFLSRPYMSEKEPLDLLFSKQSRPQEAVGSWSLVHAVGMGKSSAARIILECAVRLQLSDAELQQVAPCLQSLLRMHATYDPSGDEEQQFLDSLASKVQMAERARPDPLQVAARWSEVINAKGDNFASVIDARIKAFNQGRTDSVNIQPNERAFIKLYPHQADEFLKLLNYHWQNFKVAESAVPLKVWLNPDLSPETKVSRANGLALWVSILQWSPAKNYYWLQRCIGTFVKNIKEAQLAGKKVSLKSMANKFRCNFKDPLMHDSACVFGYFMPEWQNHLTAQQLQELLARYSKGYLNKELDEKVKVMDPNLKALDFRFMQQLTGQWSLVSGPSCQNTSEAEKAKEQAEFNLFSAKLAREVSLFEEHARKLKAFHAREHEDKVAANLLLKQKLGFATEHFCNKWLPIRRCSQAGVLPYINDVMVNFAESEGVNPQNTLQLHVVSFDKLGLRWSANLHSSVEMVANAVGTSPEHVAALVIAPNVGKPGDAYDVGKVSECEAEVEALLKEDHYNFRVVRVFLPFAEESLLRKSTRPGGTTAWFCFSKTRNAEGKFVSMWKGSYLQVRQRAHTDCPVLPRTQWLNPCAPMARPLGGDQISKGARSRRWSTGEGFWRVVMKSAVEWLNLDRSWLVFVIDVHPYDETLQKAAVDLRCQADKLPDFVVLAPIWADMGTINDGDTDSPDNGRLEVFNRRAVRLHVEAALRSGRLKVADFVLPEVPSTDAANSPPVYKEDQFVITCPNASGQLPVRQAGCFFHGYWSLVFGLPYI